MPRSRMAVVQITAEQTTREGASSFGYWTLQLFGCCLPLICFIVVMRIAPRIRLVEAPPACLMLKSSCAHATE